MGLRFRAVLLAGIVCVDDFQGEVLELAEQGAEFFFALSNKGWYSASSAGVSLAGDGLAADLAGPFGIRAVEAGRAGVAAAGRLAAGAGAHRQGAGQGEAGLSRASRHEVAHLFRIRGQSYHALSGQEAARGADLGTYWAWVKRSEPIWQSDGPVNHIYSANARTCRHDRLRRPRHSGQEPYSPLPRIEAYRLIPSIRTDRTGHRWPHERDGLEHGPLGGPAGPASTWRGGLGPEPARRAWRAVGAGRGGAPRAFRLG